MQLFNELFGNVLNFTWQQGVMIVIGCALIWCAIKREMEPALLLPMGFGAILVNLPFVNTEAIETMFNAGIATELFPLLQKYNAKATIFVIPKAIGTPHKMTAEQIYELSRSGLVSIQSHTYSHGNLSTMDEETLVFEMAESQKYLAALTGQVPYAVCYPEGTRSELSIEVAGRYYDYGLLMNGQLYNTSDDPLRVKRFYVPRGYDLGSFRWSVQEAGTSRNW